MHVVEMAQAERPHELCEIANTELTAEPDNEGVASLPPTDKGRAAWLFLAGAFVTETLIWGFPFSFGVLRTYYRTNPPISKDPSGISAVGTLCSGIMYLIAPVLYAFMQQGPLLRKYSTFTGLALAVLGIALSSLATEVWHLMLTQGILYAIGGGLLYHPILIFIDEWFIRRKSLAYGVMWAGSGVGGLCGPLVLEWGLSKYGAKTFLRGWAVTLVSKMTPDRRA